MDTRDLHLSRHAVARYCERVKPQLDLTGAKRELWALMQLADEPTDEPPEWAHTSGPRRRYAEICDGVLLVLSFHDERWWVETVLTRAGMSAASREYRNSKAARRRAYRRHRRSKINDRKQGNRQKRLGRRPASEGEAA